jgi:uncharacterized protein YndB with AHSA1/START domain
MTAAHELADRHDMIELERRIEAPADTVFSYFTDPERYRLWQGVDAELDPRPGGIFQVTMTRHSRFIARGVYLEVDPPTRVTFTWGWEPNDGLDDGQRAVPPGTSTVEVTLIPDGDATLLRLRHNGLPTPAACRIHAWGWDLTLGRLATAAAGGVLAPNPFLDF